MKYLRWVAVTPDSNQHLVIFGIPGLQKEMMSSLLYPGLLPHGFTMKFLMTLVAFFSESQEKCISNRLHSKRCYFGVIFDPGWNSILS